MNATTTASTTSGLATSTDALEEDITAATQSSLYSGSINGRVNGDTNYPQTKDERKQAAAEAMQEYLNRDDGGDAWISSIAEILDDDEDETHNGE